MSATTTPLRVALCGLPGRGKDTAARFLLEAVPAARRVGFSDPLKRLVAVWVNHLFAEMGIPRRVTPEYMLTDEAKAEFGHLFQWVGTNIGRAHHPDYWVQRFHAAYGSVPQLVVADMRFPNEAAYCAAHGFVRVRLHGPNWRQAQSEGVQRDNRDESHESERHILTLPVDLEYDNWGTLADLRSWVRDALLPYALGAAGERAA